MLGYGSPFIHSSLSEKLRITGYKAPYGKQSGNAVG